MGLQRLPARVEWNSVHVTPRSAVLEGMTMLKSLVCLFVGLSLSVVPVPVLMAQNDGSGGGVGVFEDEYELSELLSESPFGRRADVAGKQAYYIQFNQYESRGVDWSNLPVAEALDLILAKDQDGDRPCQFTEGIRLTTLPGLKNTVQNQKQIQIQTGMTYTPTARQGIPAYQSQQVGTLLTVQLTEDKKSDKEPLVLSISYEASRLSDEAPADQQKPPSIVLKSFNTTLRLEPGWPALVGSFQSGETGQHFVVTVTPVKKDKEAQEEQ